MKRVLMTLALAAGQRDIGVLRKLGHAADGVVPVQRFLEPEHLERLERMDCIDRLRERVRAAAIDHQIGVNDKIYGRVTRGTSFRDDHTANVPPMLDHVANYTQRPFSNLSIAVNWAHTFGPTFFNELSLSGSRERGRTGASLMPSRDRLPICSAGSAPTIGRRSVSISRTCGRSSGGFS